MALHNRFMSQDPLFADDSLPEPPETSAQADAAAAARAPLRRVLAQPVWRAHFGAVPLRLTPYSALAIWL